MSYSIPVHLPDDVFHALTARTGEHWFGDVSSAALCDAVRSWISKGEASTSSTGAAPASFRGYQWKQLFLPEGTMVRATFQGQVSYAKVEGDAMIEEGKCVSPSQFANAHGCGNRNAWRALWVRFPGEARWRLAAECRDAVRKMGT